MPPIPEHRHLSLGDLASFLYNLAQTYPATYLRVFVSSKDMAGAVEVDEIHVLQQAIEHVLGHVLEKDGSVVVSGPTSWSFDESLLGIAIHRCEFLCL